MQKRMSFSTADENEAQAFISCQRPDFYRIVLVGENGSGKTALMKRFIFNKFTPTPSQTPTSSQKPTQSFELPNRLRTRRLISNAPCIIELVEAEPREGSGNDGYGDAIRQISNADAVVLVYSICGLRWHPFHRDRSGGKEPLDGVSKLGVLVKGLDDEREWEGEEEGREGVVMLVLGCQKDREDLRIVTEDEGREVARDLECAFAEVEVVSGCEGLDVVVEAVVKDIREARRRRAHNVEQSSAEGEGLPVVKAIATNTGAGSIGTGLWERFLRK